MSVDGSAPESGIVPVLGDDERAFAIGVPAERDAASQARRLSAAAATVAAMSSSPWAALTKPAS